MTTAAEPCDIIKSVKGGPEVGRRLVKQLRAIGDLFEGPPPWGVADRGPRDMIDQRTPLRRSDRDEQSWLCLRCRGDLWTVTEQGFGPSDVTCPYCNYQGICPKCSKGGGIDSREEYVNPIENGKCTACGFAPPFYCIVKAFDNWGTEHAKRGACLAAHMPVPKLQWYAVGDAPYLTLVNKADFPCFTLDPNQGPAIATDFSHANADAHLEESEDWEMLKLREATGMAIVGMTIIVQGLEITDGELKALHDNIANDNYNPRITSQYAAKAPKHKIADVEAGMQLICDAYIADGKSTSPIKSMRTLIAVLSVALEAVMALEGKKEANGKVRMDRRLRLTYDLFQYIISPPYLRSVPVHYFFGLCIAESQAPSGQRLAPGCA